MDDNVHEQFPSVPDVVLLLSRLEEYHLSKVKYKIHKIFKQLNKALLIKIMLVQ
jgi:hypothetical protein